VFWVTPAARAALRAIVVPAITGDAAATTEPIPPAVALRAAAPSTLFQLPGSGGETLARVAALVRRFPCYRLRLGVRADVPRALEALL
jgi:hypothetical protein